MIGDVVLALVNMGISLQGLDSFANRENRHTLASPQQSTQGKPMNILQAGSKAPHPPHIPSYLPSLPDPHAYIRTPTHKQPITEYEAIRERAANQKRDIEKALTKFLAKTSETISLFASEENQMFPLIACKPTFPSYLAALNPTDQVFDFEELEYHFLVANRTEDVTTKEESENEEDENEKSDEKEMKSEQNDNLDNTTNITSNNDNANSSNMGGNNADYVIDNPFLRAATVPKKQNKFGNFI